TGSAQPAPGTLWVPLPHDDEAQQISAREAAGEIVKDARGNEAARVLVPAGGGTFKVSYVVDRREREGAVVKASGKPGGPAEWLQDDKLVKVDDKIRALSTEVTRGAATPVEKARKVYEYVLANMKYQKTGDGWGNGSIIW